MYLSQTKNKLVGINWKAEEFAKFAIVSVIYHVQASIFHGTSNPRVVYRASAISE